MRKVLAVLVVLALIPGRARYWAGHARGPTLTFKQPGPPIGQSGGLELVVDPLGSTIETLDVVLEQDGARTPVFTLPGDANTKLTQQPDGKMVITRPVGKKVITA